MTHEELINSNEYKQVEKEMNTYKMKKKITILLLFWLVIAIIFLSGCKAKQLVNNYSTIERNDSTTTITVKDTVIKWLPQKQEVKTNQKSKLSTDFSFSNAWIDSTGLLNHSIENFTVIPSKIKEVKIKIYKYIKINIVETLIITKKIKGDQVLKYRWFSYFDFIILGLALFGFGFFMWKRLS